MRRDDKTLRDLVSPSRRQFLKLVTVAASTAALAACGGSGDHAQTIQTNTTWFPQSVASGDPKTKSVVLWTRLGLFDAQTDGMARVQVSTKSDFTQLIVDEEQIPVAAAHDHCLRVKVTGLQPGTTYYYRFLVSTGDTSWASSRTGRTKTAPDPAANVPVKYAVTSCQDYIGRYYNVWAYVLLTQPDLDFILQIGDYIYETTGDPSYQTVGATRTVTFSDTTGAIALGSGAGTFYAASSVSNYRELYKTYRSDPVLQQVHEQYPMIGIWDDHEYSDDCWGATATYFNGLKDELNPPRRDRAEQVDYEFMPVDDPAVTSGVLNKDPATLWPNNVLYRRLRFGQNLETVLLDYRSYRPDHLIPEDGFPGKIVMSEPVLVSVLGQATYDAIKADFGPYVDTTTNPWNGYLTALIPVLAQAYIQAGYDANQAPTKATGDLTGLVSAYVFNQLVTQFNTAVAAGQIPGASALPLIDSTTYDALPRGIAYLHMGKQDFFTQMGARYAVVQPTFDLYAQYMQATGQYEQDPLGSIQRQFLADALASDATFINVISTVSTAPLRWNLSSATTLPADYQTIFKPNVDQWDGFPQGKQSLLETLANRPGAFLASGDIHASFVTAHHTAGMAMPVADFTGPAISSGTFNNFVESAIAGLPGLTADQKAAANQVLVTGLDQTLQYSAPKDEPLVFADTTKHGIMVFSVSARQTQVDYLLIDQSAVSTDLTQDPNTLKQKFTKQSFSFDPATGAVVKVG
jgi:alkaline phosphatase D